MKKNTVGLLVAHDKKIVGNYSAVYSTRALVPHETLKDEFHQARVCVINKVQITIFIEQVQEDFS